MNERAFRTLELEGLMNLLGRHIRTPLGRKVIIQLEPSSDLNAINHDLNLTSESTAYIRGGGSFDLSDIVDPEQSLAQIHIEGARLDPEQILALERLLGAGMDLRGQFNSREQSERYPLLSAITSTLPDLRHLLKSISGKILPNGEIDDNASPELRQVRRQINISRARIYSSLESIMHQKEGAIQDDVVTVRNGRFVIPVRTDSRGQVLGVVHALSSSGVTSYVEPMTVIEQNNDLVRLREREELEIARVLLAITEALGANSHEIRRVADAVARVDAVQAKARLSIEFNCTRPEMADSNRLLLKMARHPLLEYGLKQSGGAVVPISLDMDQDHQVLVISGPNAGGKTVVLKTVGLLSLMAQMGLHVPAEEARLPVFDQVFADIGDQQSIAANLSTFTAHIRNVAEMISAVNPPALILIDEVGTGTDPDEGAALGVAIIDFFHSAGATTIATTHYNRLKVWASQTEGVLNASVEFDEQTLSPTYQLITGIAGASSGLEIARRMGLPEPVTSRARSLLDPAHEEANEYLKRLKALSARQEADLEALEEERQATAEKFALLDLEFARRETGRRAQFEAELARIVDELRAESNRLLTTVNDRVIAARLKKDTEALQAQLRASGARLRKKSGVITAVLSAEGKAAGHNAVDAGVAVELPSAVVEPERALKERDIVRISSLGQQGMVESIDGDTYTIVVGSLRYRARRSELELAHAAEPQKSKAAAALPSGITANLAGDENENFSSELNVIGAHVDEAVDRVDKFLDEAFLAGAETVRIVHGHGKGALRRAVSELLSGHPHIESFNPAPSKEGGAGATVAILKK
jgi:DNA mismatch repair protein MutS2